MTAVELVEITDANRDEVLALRVAPEQQQFVGTVAGALRDAADYRDANPWYRAIYADGRPVGLIMISWDVPPRPPDIIGPWYLWKLIIDQAQQYRGHGAAAVRQVAEIVRAAGAPELLTSYVVAPGGPAGFYAKLGFTPTGDVDRNGEVIVRLDLTV